MYICSTKFIIECINLKNPCLLQYSPYPQQAPKAKWSIRPVLGEPCFVTLLHLCIYSFGIESSLFSAHFENLYRVMRFYTAFIISSSNTSNSAKCPHYLGILWNFFHVWPWAQIMKSSHCFDLVFHSLCICMAGFWGPNWQNIVWYLWILSSHPYHFLAICVILITVSFICILAYNLFFIWKTFASSLAMSFTMPYFYSVQLIFMILQYSICLCVNVKKAIFSFMLFLF